MSLPATRRAVCMRTPSSSGSDHFAPATYSKRVRRWEIVIPIAALAFLLYTLYHNIWPVPAHPYNLFPYIVGAWIALSLVAVFAVPGFSRRMGNRLREEDGLTVESGA